MERGALNFDNYVYYDETSPTFLRWKIDILAGKTGKTKIKSAGDVAGCFIRNSDSSPKCIDVRIGFRSYKVHRIIYEIMSGEIPEKYVIDHLDQDPWNNNINNLSAKPKAANHRNQKLSSRNSSGKNGVTFRIMNRGKHTYVEGYVQCDNKRFSARFSVHKLGLLPAFLEACKYRDSMQAMLNATLDADFTKLHGKPKDLTEESSTAEE